VSVSHRSISWGGGLINEPLLASDASPEAADNSPLLPQIDIDRIEPWRRGEGEKLLSWLRISIETHLLVY
jgi:hypothetical protein